MLAPADAAPGVLATRAPAGFGVGNKLLAALTHGEQAVLAMRSERVELRLGECLLKSNVEIEHVIFPSSGLVSLFQEIPEGVIPDGLRSVVGLVGREGLVGLPALLGDSYASRTAMVQVPGHGYRIPADALRPLAESGRNLRDLIRRFALASLIRLSVQAGCLATHPLEPRTARWLLDIQDRVGNVLPITQGALATLLGAQRPTVNMILGGLKTAGLIRHTRGRIAITDRAGLERAACPCYRLGREAVERVLPRSFR